MRFIDRFVLCERLKIVVCIFYECCRIVLILFVIFCFKYNNIIFFEFNLIV